MKSVKMTRQTSETAISLILEPEGTGFYDIYTGVGFFDHMLIAMTRHGRFDLTVHCEGDTEVDDHHTVEDVGLTLGAAFRQAMGDKRGITRFGQSLLPMDEALILVALDISGRGRLYFDVPMPQEKVGSFDTALAEEFMIAFAQEAGVTLHIRSLAGKNAHHVIEAMFKAVGRALRQALTQDGFDDVPSTKGTLS